MSDKVQLDCWTNLYEKETLVAQSQHKKLSSEIVPGLDRSENLKSMIP